MKKLKIFKNKKGLDFAALLFLVAVISISNVYVVLETKLQKDFDRTLGEDQVAILNSYQEADNVLFYIDKSAEFSASAAMKILTTNAGFAYKDGCNQNIKFIPFDSKNYILLNYESNSKHICKADNIYQNFFELMNTELDSFFDLYPETRIKKELKNNNYEFLVDNDNLYGFAQNNIAFSIFPKKFIERRFLGFTISKYKVVSGKIGEYITRPSFKIPFTANLNNFNDFYDNIQSLMDVCFRPNIITTTEGCVLNNHFAKQWKVQKMENKDIYLFITKLNNQDSYFALYIKELNPKPVNTPPSEILQA